MEKQLIQIKAYVKGIWKYRLIALLVAWVIALAGWGWVVMKKDQYETTARVFVDTQSVLQPLMSGMATPMNLSRQVEIMSRTLISRPNVERVMRMVDLDLQADTPEKKEQMILELLEDIRMKSAGDRNLYIISYRHSNPQLARDVVQALLSIFVESGLAGKKQGAESAVLFIDQQIQEYEQRLLQAENSLKEFKQRNQNMMPGNGDYSSRMLNAENILSQAQLDLKEAEQARNVLHNQLRQYQAQANQVTQEQNAAVPKAMTETEAQLIQLQRQLDALLLNYTDIHPDVIATKELIAQLEQRRQQEQMRIRPSQPARSSTSLQDPVLQQLQLSLAQAEANIASINARVSEYSQRYYELKAMSDSLPEVEAQLAQLNRDYGINKSNYEELLQKRETARMSGNLSDQTDLVSFKIVDPPSTPLVPSGPDRIKYFTVVLILALGAGSMLSLLISQIRPVFYTTESLCEITQRPVLGVVSRVPLARDISRQRRSVMVFAFGGLMLLALFMALSAKEFFRISLF